MHLYYLTFPCIYISCLTNPLWRYSNKPATSCWFENFQVTRLQIETSNSVIPHRKSRQFTWLTISILLSSRNLCDDNYEAVLSKQWRKSHFTKCTTQQSHDFLMKRCIRKNGRCMGIDSVKPFFMQTGIVIGTGNAFLCRRFRFACQVLHYHYDYQKFVWGVIRAPCAVTFVTTEMLKNVLKPQGAP